MPSTAPCLAGAPVLTIPAAAFLGALLVGCSLHYRKIVKNAWFGYPQEWFPSVSAAIGDEYPERSLFQLLIAITAGMIYGPLLSPPLSSLAA